MELELVETPEDAIELSHLNNYWVESGNEAKFLFVDANFTILLLVSTINIFNAIVLTCLAVSFTFLSILSIKNITVAECISKTKLLLCLKKYRRK